MRFTLLLLSVKLLPLFSFLFAENADDLIQKMILKNEKVGQELLQWQYSQHVLNKTEDLKGKEKDREEFKMIVRPRSETSFKILNPQGAWVHGGAPGDEWARKGRNIQRQLQMVSLKTLIEQFDFQSKGEEIKDGIQTHRFHLTPKPSFKPKTRIEKLMREVEGDLWVDLKTETVFKVEGILRKPVSVAWLLATVESMKFEYQTVSFPWGYGMSGFRLELLLNKLGGKSVHHREVQMSEFQLNVGQDLW